MPDVRDGHPETSDAGERVVNRIREISAQSMIQTTAAGQLTRALRAKTGIGGEGLYRVGDLVDYHRPPPSKEVSGWTGPVPVIENKPERRQVICRIEGRNMPCRYPDVRHTLLVLYTFLVGEIGQVNGAVQVVLSQ